MHAHPGRLRLRHCLVAHRGLIPQRGKILLVLVLVILILILTVLQLVLLPGRLLVLPVGGDGGVLGGVEWNLHVHLWHGQRRRSTSRAGGGVRWTLHKLMLLAPRGEERGHVVDGRVGVGVELGLSLSLSLSLGERVGVGVGIGVHGCLACRGRTRVLGPQDASTGE